MSFERLTTEHRDPSSSELDSLSVNGILDLMNRRDRTVCDAIELSLPDIASAVELLEEAWRSGGRWIYVGAGTSGRIAALDAAECPPTFGVPADRVVAVVAGGDASLNRAVASAEDDQEAALRDLEKLILGPTDALVGVAASGRTPYVIAAVRHAAERGCSTIGISNNADSQLSDEVDIAIELSTGPEIITGSTRLKAGTSQKMVLNMLSTAAFTRLGRVFENQMVDLQVTNEKLRARALRIISETLDVSIEQATELLNESGGSIKVAIVSKRGAVSIDRARHLIEEAGGRARDAIEQATSTGTS